MFGNLQINGSEVALAFVLCLVFLFFIGLYNQRNSENNLVKDRYDININGYILSCKYLPDGPKSGHGRDCYLIGLPEGVNNEK